MKNITMLKFATVTMVLSCLLAGCRAAAIHTPVKDEPTCATIAEQQESTAPAATTPASTEPAETEPAPTPPAETEPVPTEPTETESVPTEPAETEPVSTAPMEAEPAPTKGLTDYTPDAFALALLEGVNQARAEHGLPALVLDATVCRLAYVRAQEAAVQWSHTRPNGLASHSVYPEYGVPWPHCVGENLANYALQDATRIVNAWMDSDGHRRNILYPDYTGAGMAVYFDGEKYYIANLFFG